MLRQSAISHARTILDATGQSTRLRCQPHVASRAFSSTSTSHDAPPQQQQQQQQQHNHSSSVSDTEVSHFNALAADWWSPYGSSRLLHLMNPLRHDFIASCLSSSPPASSASASATTTTTGSSRNLSRLRYLDIGCGGGIFAESAARLPTTSYVLGIDPTPGVLAVARAHARRDPLLANTGRLEYRQASIEELAVPQQQQQSEQHQSEQQQQQQQQQFDVLSVFEVVEHVERPSVFLERCLPFVRPGGWIVGSTIARTTASWLTTKVVAEDVLRIVPRGTHDWNKYINEEEIRDWFAKRDGWGHFTSQGVAYVPLLGWKLIPGSERFGNYFFAARKNNDDVGSMQK